MGNLHSSIDKSNLVDCLDLWWKSSVDAKDFSFDNSSDAQVVEDLGTVLPWVCIAVFSDSLVVKAVDGGDLAGFVVSSEQSDVRWVLHFETQQQLESLHRVEASVDEVAHEDVSGVWNFAALVEQLEQVVELTMNVSANGDWCFDRLHIALLNEDLFDFLTKDAKFSLRQDSSLLDGLKPIIDVALAHFQLIFI